MSQEFIIKSQQLEDKINQLLPSQGGFQAGVDLSASTQIIPIVDLTETAEGSLLRQDLQTSFSLTSLTFTNQANTSGNLIATPGFYRVFGIVNFSGAGTATISLTDGTTTKVVYTVTGGGGYFANERFDFNVVLEAGHILTGASSAATCQLRTSTRQLADINGNLVNP